jgi:hypothetical protein
MAIAFLLLTPNSPTSLWELANKLFVRTLARYQGQELFINEDLAWDTSNPDIENLKTLCLSQQFANPKAECLIIHDTGTISVIPENNLASYFDMRMSIKQDFDTKPRRMDSAEPRSFEMRARHLYYEVMFNGEVVFEHRKTIHLPITGM